MDYTILVQLIGSLGFPIVAFFYIHNSQVKTFDNLSAQLATLTDVVNTNTLVLQQLKVYLEVTNGEIRTREDSQTIRSVND